MSNAFETHRVRPRFFDQVGHETMYLCILVEISIFSLNHVILRPTKIMNNLLKDFKIHTFKAIFQHGTYYGK